MYALVIHHLRLRQQAGEGGQEWFEEKKQIMVGFHTRESALAEGDKTASQFFERTRQEIARDRRKSSHDSTAMSWLDRKSNSLASSEQNWYGSGVLLIPSGFGETAFVEVISYEPQEWIYLSTEMWEEVFI